MKLNRDLFTLSGALLMSPLFAGDFYVDAVNGSNQNGGLAQGDAWRTLTHALQVVAPPVQGSLHTIHVAAGNHDALLGEVFPLVVRPGIAIEGAGAAATTIDGGGTAIALVDFTSGAAQPEAWPMAQLSGCGLRDALIGVRIVPSTFRVLPRLLDLEIGGMSQSGVSAIGGDSIGGTRDYRAALERVSIVGGGMAVYAEGSENVSWITLSECTLRGNTEGLVLWGGHNPGEAFTVFATLSRGRIDHNTQDGVRIEMGALGNYAIAVIYDSAITDNGSAGIRGYGDTLSPFAAHVDRCTVANNGQFGIVGSIGGSLDVHDSILWGQPIDLILPHFFEILHNDIGNAGSLAGQNGNISVDPRFVDAAAGDFRLQFGSPCIERGVHTGYLPGIRDLRGTLRPVDGDLDTRKAPDMGAFEFTPLFIESDPHVGGELVIECWGPQQARVWLWFAQGGLAAPQSTPFGTFELDSASAFPWGVAPTGSSPPMLLRRSLGGDPSLAGQSFSVQGRMGSRTVPAGQAWTNAVSFTVRP